MKKLYLRISLLTLLCILVGTIAAINAQVGINTTSPSDGAMLDIDSDDKGLLVPRVNIADLSTIAPITGGSTESLLVYNPSSYTNAVLASDGYLNTGDVTTGFFTVGGNGFITLPARTHTVSLIIFAGGGAEVTDDGSGSPIAAEGYQITFGANAFNRFQIVYHN